MYSWFSRCVTCGSTGTCVQESHIYRNDVTTGHGTLVLSELGNSLRQGLIFGSKGYCMLVIMKGHILYI